MNTQDLTLKDVVACHAGPLDCTGCVFYDDEIGECNRLYVQENMFPCTARCRADNTDVIWVLNAPRSASIPQSFPAQPVYSVSYTFLNGFVTNEKPVADFVQNNYDLIETIFTDWTRSYEDLVEALFMLKTN